MKYAHLFNSASQRGHVDLYLTATPSMEGATLHSSYRSKREARAAVKALGAQAWNF